MRNIISSFLAVLFAVGLTSCSHLGSSTTPKAIASSSRLAHAFYLGKRPTREHRAAAIAKLQKSASSAGRSPRLYVDHFKCTDWFQWQQDRSTADAVDPGAGEWVYAYTTCDYVDSFWIDDGMGYGPGQPKSSNNGSGRDNLLQGCKTAAGTAKVAERAHIIDNPGYEWAGFVVQGPDGSLYYTQGELLSLTDNLADIGSPDQHSFPPGYVPVGYYHSHLDRPPTSLDDTTHGHFSAADEKYANDYNLDAYVMLLWTNTSFGTAQQHASFLGWHHHGDPGTSGETDNNKESC